MILTSCLLPRVCFHHTDVPLCLICLSILSLMQFAQSETSDGYKLPASDGHAHRKNLLLHQRGAGPIPQLPDRDPENYLQPGNVWQPAGVFVRACVTFLCPSYQNLSDPTLWFYIKVFHACKEYKLRLSLAWLTVSLYHLIFWLRADDGGAVN